MDEAPGKATRFSLDNARGDVTTQVDAAGNVTWQASYEAFGTRTREKGLNWDAQRANGLSRATAYQCTLRAVFLHRFAEGGSKDEDPTGLLNEGFRYRDLEAGVFISRDPAGFVDGPNVYCYVVQNPWTAWDPEGLAERDWGGFFMPAHASAYGNSEINAYRYAYRRSAYVCSGAAAIENRRVQGGLRVMSGVAEGAAAVACAIAPEPSGATKLLAVATGGHAIDQVQAGVRQMFSNEVEQSYTEKGISSALRFTGMNRESAEICAGVADTSLGTVLSLGSSISSTIRTPWAGMRSLQTANLLAGKTDSLREGVMTLRKVMGIGPGRNCAGLEYMGENGRLQYMFACNSGDLHAERILIDMMKINNVDPSKVTRFYSEIIPCAGKYLPDKLGCRMMLKEELPFVTPEYDYTNPRALWGELRKRDLTKELTRERSK
jgi:RHS repeat-associated protein